MNHNSERRCTMVNTALLLNAITRCGKTILDCAAALGVSKKTMKRKIQNTAQFKASEIEKLIVLLSLSKQQFEAIFFCAVL